MSDLISRSELISRIESEYREYGEDYDVEQILGDIEDMPTAYSVDKVVDELESAENYYYDDKFDEEGDLVMFKSIEQSVAIEIVKQGGKEILQ